MLATHHSFSFPKPQLFLLSQIMRTTLLLLIQVVCIKIHNRTGARSLKESTSRFEPENFFDSKKSWLLQRDDLTDELVWSPHAVESRGPETGIGECPQTPKRIKYLTFPCDGSNKQSLGKIAQSFHVLWRPRIEDF